MRILNCEQGTAQWFAARLGKPTASHFGDIITREGHPRKGERPRKYVLELLGERITQYPTQNFETEAMRRGVENEPRARAWYELTTGRDVTQVGLCVEDGGRWACSPDGLCRDRGIEIKCPMQLGFVDFADSLEIPDAHFLQMQAGMWITGAKLWDYVVWTDCRGLVPQIITVSADAELHDAFSKIIPAFCDALDEREKKMRDQGHGVIAKEVEDDGEPIFADE